jgi:hypothetical protein
MESRRRWGDPPPRSPFISIPFFSISSNPKVSQTKTIPLDSRENNKNETGGLYFFFPNLIALCDKNKTLELY